MDVHRWLFYSLSLNDSAVSQPSQRRFIILSPVEDPVLGTSDHCFLTPDLCLPPPVATRSPYKQPPSESFGPDLKFFRYVRIMLICQCVNMGLVMTSSGAAASPELVRCSAEVVLDKWARIQYVVFNMVKSGLQMCNLTAGIIG